LINEGSTLCFSNQQIERIPTTLKPLIFNMLLEKENGKSYREEFIAKLGRRQLGRILSVLPRGGTKKQRYKSHFQLNFSLTLFRLLCLK